VGVFSSENKFSTRLDSRSKWGYTDAKWGKVVESRATLFLGQFEHSLDDKNRLFLPALFRGKNNGSSFIMTQGLERCLFLFPPSAWETLATKLEHLPLSDKVEERAFKRTLLAGACEAAADPQGRILIPQMLVDYAQIRRDAVVLGVLHHVEIWSRERWIPYQKKARASFEKVAPHLEL
jgi:MraZ protein